MQSTKSINQERDRQAIKRKRSRDWYYENKDKPGFKEDKRERVLKWRDENPESYLLQRAKARAKERNVDFSLTESDIKIPEMCPVLKVPFEYGTPYATSIDRINPKLGYIPGNVQIISWKANMMKQDASPEELRKFANWVNQSLN